MSMPKNAASLNKAINYKIVLLGDSSVGKTSITERFVRDQFIGFQQPTIGASFLTQTIELKSGAVVRFQIWDTAGQERYRSLAPMYYRGATAALVVYDITNTNSFIGAKDWIDELQRQANNSNIIIGIVGNKLDIESDRKVSREEGLELAKSKSSSKCLFFESSAKTGVGVRDIFLEIAEKLPSTTNSGTSDKVDINSQNTRTFGCC